MANHREVHWGPIVHTGRFSRSDIYNSKLEDYRISEMVSHKCGICATFRAMCVLALNDIVRVDHQIWIILFFVTLFLHKQWQQHMVLGWGRKQLSQQDISVQKDR